MIRIHLFRGISVQAVNLWCDPVTVFNGIDILLDSAAVTVQKCLKRAQIVCADLRKQLVRGFFYPHLVCIGVSAFSSKDTAACILHQRGQIISRFFYLQRIQGERLRLLRLDKPVCPAGEREYQRNTDNSNGACKGNQQCPCLLGPQVVAAQRQRRKKRHGSPSHVSVHRHLLFLPPVFRGIGVRLNSSVPDVHNSGCVLLCQFRVMRNHNNQTILRDFLQNIHDLDAGFRVQGAGRLVRQHNVRVIDQRTRDGHPLHLSAGEL